MNIFEDYLEKINDTPLFGLNQMLYINKITKEKNLKNY